MRKSILLQVIFILITAFFNSCKKEDISPNYTTVKNTSFPPLITDLTYTILNCELPYQVRFSYTCLNSTGSDTCQWFWTDSATSNSCSSVVKTYSNLGVDTVTLVIKNTRGQTTKSLVFNINQSSLPVTSSFSSDVTSVYTGGSINFYNYSLRATNYLWDFGDGYYSQNVNPNHQYNVAGSYYVKLWAICSGDTAVSYRSVIVNAPVPFTISNFKLHLSDSYLESDVDDAHERPDYYLAVYLDGSYIGSTNIINNILYFPVWWDTNYWNFSIFNIDRRITIELWEYDYNGTNDYKWSYSFTTH